MNLEGKIVKFHMYDQKDHILNNDRGGNNYTDTCPALVLSDWTPQTDDLTGKSLNLRVFPDNGEPFQVNSAMHVEASGTYLAADVQEHEDVKAKAGCWEMPGTTLVEL